MCIWVRQYVTSRKEFSICDGGNGQEHVIARKAKALRTAAKCYLCVDLQKDLLIP